RKVLSRNEIKRMSRELLTPTRIYTKPILNLLSTIDHRPSVIHGIAHITGGSFYDKISRILPREINVRIDKNSWKVPDIFKLIQSKGNIEDKEMYRTLNMGIGLVLIVKNNQASAIINKLSGLKLKSRVIGAAVKGKKEVIIG
ncbi:MAG: AIR synthase-related protein, partial [Candidatus Omnitrophota bacterium]